MLKCKDYKEMVSAQMDGEISPEEEQELNEHLKTCSECLSFAEEMQAMKADLPVWNDIQVPSDVEHKILNKTVYKRGNVKKSILSVFAGYYRIPRGLAWASGVIILVLIVNAVINLNGFLQKSEIPELRQANQPIIQKVTITENDLVSYSAFGKQNGS